jgi:low affinity Fe/Cu permease
MNGHFRKLAQMAANAVGAPWAFMVALTLVLLWLVTGPAFDYSDTWQLVINTATTIVTFLMVFLIQNTQNRDAKVIHLKLDELLRALDSARTGFVDLEELSDEDLAQVQTQFHELHKRYGDAVAPLHRMVDEHARRETNRRRSRSADKTRG